jgi:hypothetical protein
MIQRNVSMVEIGLIAGTRVALGIGIGLLLAGRFSDRRRKKMGLSLAIAGGLSTIPLALRVMRKGPSDQEIVAVA